MQILTPYFERPLVLVSTISPDLNMAFDCPYPTLEIYQNSQQIFTSQKRWRQIMHLCMFIVNQITFNSCWRKSTFYVSYCRDLSWKQWDTTYSGFQVGPTFPYLFVELLLFPSFSSKSPTLPIFFPLKMLPLKIKNAKFPRSLRSYEFKNQFVCLCFLCEQAANSIN